MTAPLPPPIAALSTRVLRRVLDPELDWASAREEADAIIPAVLKAQREHIQVVDRFLRAQRIGLGAPWWQQAVPSELFRAARLFAGSEDAISQRFESSGTTDRARRSVSLFSPTGLELMEASIFSNARRHLFPEGRLMRILVLAPSPARAPQMIMAWGMQKLIEEFGLPGSAFLIDEGGLNPDDVVGRLNTALYDKVPVTLIGASAGFVKLLDHLQSKNLKFKLPTGSRTLDAGGYKGVGREVPPAELRAAIGAALGIAPGYSVNLLGMTELASQLYDDTLAATVAKRKPTFKVNPPWTRTVAVDPETGEPAAEGERGLLVHLDLANIERPCVVRTSDIGRQVGGAFEILGRAEGADAAGCSLTVQAFLARERR